MSSAKCPPRCLCPSPELPERSGDQLPGAGADHAANVAGESQANLPRLVPADATLVMTLFGVLFGVEELFGLAAASAAVLLSAAAWLRQQGRARVSGTASAVPGADQPWRQSCRPRRPSQHRPPRYSGDGRKLRAEAAPGHD